MSFNIIQSLNLKVTKQAIRDTNRSHGDSIKLKTRSKSLEGFINLLPLSKRIVTEQDENIEYAQPKCSLLNSQRVTTEFGYKERKNLLVSKRVQRVRWNQKTENDLIFKQRRLSCCCSNCGQFGRKARKFHDVLITKVQDKKVQPVQKKRRNMRECAQTIAKTTRVCISFKTIPKEEKEERVEFSPKQLTFDQQCKAISRRTATQTLPALKKPLVQDYLRKMNNLNNLIEHTQLISIPSSNLIRNSAPNLDAFDKCERIIGTLQSIKIEHIFDKIISEQYQLIQIQGIQNKIMKYFQFWNQSNDIEQQTDPQERSGFVSKFSQSLTFFKPQSVVAKVQDVQQAASNWKNFAIFFGIGICFIFVALTFLPVVMLFPAKFGGLFSLGSLSLWISLYIIKGGKNFVKMFCNKEKIIYSTIYVFMLIATFYFSILHKNYILVLLFSIAQIIALGWLFASSFPAGITGMKFITKQILALMKQIISLCFKSQQSKSFLPI